MEGCGVAVVVGEGGGEAVGAVHLVGGTEIEVVGLFCVDDGVDAGFRGQADGGGWQAGVEVGVEGTLHRKVFVENALEGEVTHGILHRGVGLEGHAALQTVDVHTGYQWLLGVVVGFFINYRSQNHCLQSRIAVVGEFEKVAP